MSLTLARLTRSTVLALGFVLVAGVFGPTWAHRGAQRPALVDIVPADASVATDATVAVPSPRAGLTKPASIRLDPAAATMAPVAGAVAMIVALVATGLLARSPRMLRLVLVLAVAVMGAEAAIHAVHHLGDDQSAARCAVAAVCGHLAGTVVDDTSVEGNDTVSQELPPAEPAPRAARALRPDQGRSPPA